MGTEKTVTLLSTNVRTFEFRRLWVVLGIALVVIGTVGAFGAGELIASGTWLAPWATHRTPSAAFEVGVGLLPLLAVVAAGLALL